MADEILSLGEALRRLAAAQPDAPAITSEGRTVTYGDFNRSTNRIARAMAANGVKLGDLVTIGLPNSIGFLEACFASWKLGATPQPISFRLPGAEVDAICELANPPLVVARPDIETRRSRFEIEDLLTQSSDDSDLPDVTAPVLKAPTSGGSTGRPKLILSGSPGVIATTPTLEGEGPWRLKPDDVALMPGPLYHNGPFSCALTILALGAHLVLLPRFDAEATLAAIDRHKASWIYVVPTMMSRMWKLPDAVKARYDPSSLRVLWHLAAPCPPALKEAWIDWVGAETVHELYAGTEAQAVTTITGSEWLTHRGSVGQVKAGEMVAMSEAGEPLPPGEVGEIYMRPAEGAPPTYHYAGATARTLPGGWESLGDIGWFDAEGYLYLADRRTDMILVGGSNVYPAEIEAALDEHPLVASSAVIGLPHEDLGSTVHAIIQPRGELDEAQLRAHMAERLVTYKQPRTYELVTENIRDDAGKVRRTALRDERIAALKQV